MVAEEVLTIQGHDFSYDVFISYRHQEPDRLWVREKLLPRLQAEGFKVLDIESFRLGAPLVEQMARIVDQSRYILVVLSSAYLQRDFSPVENVLTAHLGLEESQRRLLAVSREPVRLRLGIPARLMLDMSNDEQFETGIARLVHELNRPASAAGLGVPDHASRPGRNLTFQVVEGDIMAFAADLVAFKYAQGFHGADRRAA